MNTQRLSETAAALVAGDRGLLAMDESTATCNKRFAKLGIDQTAEMRRRYRDLIVTTPRLGKSISGAILYDETIRQQTNAGLSFIEALTRADIIPGIKVDAGAKALAGFAGEQVTEGLDGLRERIAEYAAMGARFAKWRAVIDIADGIPSAFAVRANAHALARYAALCQESDIVPIVEPEVLMDGAHSIERCEQVTEAVLARVFQELFEHRVMLEGMVLKPNMVISGKKAANRAPPQAVAEATLRVLRRHVPPAVPGIAFLSGGQSPTEATLHLSLMNKLAPLPWSLTFSYGRALQDTALKAWGGVASNFAVGQKELAKRAKLNGLATTGRYAPDMESQAA